jgi:hypothetical protein
MARHLCPLRTIKKVAFYRFGWDAMPSEGRQPWRLAGMIVWKCDKTVELGGHMRSP